MDMLLQRVDVSVRKKDWRRTAGMFDGDPLMREIIEEGQRVREEDRRKTSVRSSSRLPSIVLVNGGAFIYRLISIDIDLKRRTCQFISQEIV